MAIDPVAIDPMTIDKASDKASLASGGARNRETGNDIAPPSGPVPKALSNGGLRPFKLWGATFFPRLETFGKVV